MSQDRNRKITPSERIGFFQNLSLRIKLVLRLMADRRVSPWLKILPVGSLLYLVIPDPALGPIDDTLIIWLGAYLFVELCPPEVVQEHMRALSGGSTGSEAEPIDEAEIVDAEFWEGEKGEEQ
ncbi:MAG TPA: hypothetical protein VJL34_14875 [Anaerolineales bacterium]|nr:hypothetical protein [Anaerolineales bacterium]